MPSGAECYRFGGFTGSGHLSGLAQQPTAHRRSGGQCSRPVTLTLQDALARARVNQPQYRSALTEYGIARQNTVQSRAGLLPNVNYTGQYFIPRETGQHGALYRSQRST